MADLNIVPSLNTRVYVKDPDGEAEDIWGTGYVEVAGAAEINMPNEESQSTDIVALTGVAQVATHSRLGQITVSIPGYLPNMPYAQLLRKKRDDKTNVQVKIATPAKTVGTVAAAFQVKADGDDGRTTLAIEAVKRKNVETILQPGHVLNIEVGPVASGLFPIAAAGAGTETAFTVIEVNNDYSEAVIQGALKKPAPSNPLSMIVNVPSLTWEDIPATVASFSDGDLSSESAWAGNLVLDMQRALTTPAVGVVA